MPAAASAAPAPERLWRLFASASLRDWQRAADEVYHADDAKELVRTMVAPAVVERGTRVAAACGGVIEAFRRRDAMVKEAAMVGTLIRVQLNVIGASGSNEQHRTALRPPCWGVMLPAVCDLLARAAEIPAVMLPMLTGLIESSLPIVAEILRLDGAVGDACQAALWRAWDIALPQVPASGGVQHAGVAHGLLVLFNMAAMLVDSRGLRLMEEPPAVVAAHAASLELAPLALLLASSQGHWQNWTPPLLRLFLACPADAPAPTTIGAGADRVVLLAHLAGWFAGLPGDDASFDGRPLLRTVLQLMEERPPRPLVLSMAVVFLRRMSRWDARRLRRLLPRGSEMLARVERLLPTYRGPRHETMCDLLRRMQRIAMLEQMRRDMNVRVCHGCGAAAARKCERCRDMFYCSRECQVADWPRHRRHCTAPPEGAMLPSARAVALMGHAGLRVMEAFALQLGELREREANKGAVVVCVFASDEADSAVAVAVPGALAADRPPAGVAASPHWRDQVWPRLEDELAFATRAPPQLQHTRFVVVVQHPLRLADTEAAARAATAAAVPASGNAPASAAVAAASVSAAAAGAPTAAAGPAAPLVVCVEIAWNFLGL